MTPLRIRLSELRAARGLTQLDLAQAAGVRQATISELESGKKKRLGLDVIERLCNALDCEPGQLLERTPSRRKR